MKISYNWKLDPFTCKECGGLLDWLDGDNLFSAGMRTNNIRFDSQCVFYKEKLAINAGLNWFRCKSCNAHHSAIDLFLINSTNINEAFVHEYFHHWRNQCEEPYRPISIDWEKKVSPLSNPTAAAYLDTEEGRVFNFELGCILTEEDEQKNDALLLSSVEKALDLALSEGLFDDPMTDILLLAEKEKQKDIAAWQEVIEKHSSPVTYRDGFFYLDDLSCPRCKGPVVAYNFTYEEPRGHNWFCKEDCFFYTIDLRKDFDEENGQFIDKEEAVPDVAPETLESYEFFQEHQPPQLYADKFMNLYVKDAYCYACKGAVQAYFVSESDPMGDFWSCADCRKMVDEKGQPIQEDLTDPPF